MEISGRDAVQQIKDLFDIDRLQPQDRLPPERILAERLNLSRSAVRKALAVLEEEGRIWRHVGRGTFVGPRPNDEQAVLTAVTAETNPAEIMEARLVLEPKLAALAALKATIKDLDQMDTYLKRSVEAVNIADFEHWDSQLHSAVAKASDNSLLYSLFQMVNNTRQDALWGRLKEASLTPERRTRYCRQHEEIVTALKNRDATGAEEAMRTHIETVLGHLLSIPANKSD
jgi:DNA-binding FadR family transcriptional regulator